MVYAKTCLENHTNPSAEITQGHKAIGIFAGWSAFQGIINAGIYGLSQSVIDQINDWNDTYQQDEYIPRQEEFNQIDDDLNSVHTCNNDPCPICGETHVNDSGYRDYEALKLERAAEIFMEIDLAHATLRAACRQLITDSQYDAFIGDNQ